MYNTIRRLFLLGLMARIRANGQPLTRVEICSLFGNLPAFNGKMIEVTGAIQALPGSRETTPWLSGEQCQATIRVKGLEYRDTINLTSSRFPPPFVDHKVDFDWDTASDVALGGLLSRMDARTEEIQATVVGLFETRVPTDSLVIITPAHPEGARNGYGHLNGNPAQIIVKTVKDMYIVKKREVAAPR
jgi:hypothetical protein